VPLASGLNEEVGMFHVDRNKCLGCGICVQRCPVGAITLVEGKAVIDQDKCTGCGACVQICPGKAISEVGVPKRAPVGTGSRLVPALSSTLALLGRLTAPYLMDVSTGRRGRRGRGFRRRKRWGRSPWS